MTFNDLAIVLASLEKTHSRNLITEILAKLFKEVSLTEIKPVVYLVLGKLGPSFKRVDFGLADKMVVRAIALAKGMTTNAIWREYKLCGDLGAVAEQSSNNKGKKIDVNKEVGEVFESLLGLAVIGGEGSQDKKIEWLSDLIKELSFCGAKYVIRMVLGKMRLGFSDQTIIDALSVIDCGSKVASDKIEYYYQISPDIGYIAHLVKEFGVEKLGDKVRVEAGVPVMPALAQRLKTAKEMIAKMGEVIVEPKYDGARIQIHKIKDGRVMTFARSLEENVAMFPELLEGIKQIKAEDIIIDSEAVGFDPISGELKPFQETITRKRKYDVTETSLLVPLKFFCFDVLYKDGNSLLDQPLVKRREILKEAIGEGKILVVDPSIFTKNPEELKIYHQKQLSKGLEGVMVKQLRGNYLPGRTGWNWVKFKEVEETSGKLSDTVDAVVMGYYRGKGKRTGFGVGAFLVGVIKEGEYVTIAKIGTGLNDNQWKELKYKLDNVFTINKPVNYKVSEGLIPDVWVEPVVVVEIAADEITKSPAHTSGLGLRFPRLVRFRDDKKPNQATSIEELGEIS